MASEASIRASLTVRVGNLDYRSNPTAFLADVAVGRGPTPGLILATLDGTDVDLTLLTQPGLCWVQNLDDENFVTIGIFDPVDNEFHPLLELLPGEFYPFRLSRYVQEELAGTGTSATTGKTIRVKADYAPCEVRFDAFDASET